jgi:hypothetical protein
MGQKRYTPTSRVRNANPASHFARTLPESRGRERNLRSLRDRIGTDPRGPPTGAPSRPSEACRPDSCNVAMIPADRGVASVRHRSPSGFVYFLATLTVTLLARRAPEMASGLHTLQLE